MKYSRLTGLLFCLLIIAAAFLPWITIALNRQTYTGMQTGTSALGEPGYGNIVLALLILIGIGVNRIWSIRLNIVFSALLIAYNIRNYLIFTRCEMGYCPEKEAGLYLTVLAAILILISCLLPSDPKDFKPG
ncbi:MAG TPA: hypothetical protein VNE41_09315 [Chitinophagaceae bacterium]|nr:hypothetical protein [Chitinophagaceae bacterium]